MSTKTTDSERQALVHLLRSGKTPAEAAKELGRARSWCYKWQGRFRQAGWAGLKERSRAPQRVARKTSERVRQTILRTRSKLEAEALQPDHLGYIGAGAILGRLQSQGLTSLPSLSTIERVLRQAGASKPRQPKSKKEVDYPTLHATTVQQLTQVDIVPHYFWMRTFRKSSCCSTPARTQSHLAMPCSAERRILCTLFKKTQWMRSQRAHPSRITPSTSPPALRLYL